MKKNSYMKPLCSVVEVGSELHLLSVSNEGNSYIPSLDDGCEHDAKTIDDLINRKGAGGVCPYNPEYSPGPQSKRHN